MTAVLTASMSLRIILSVRGGLANGGTFPIMTRSQTSGSRTQESSSRSGGPIVTPVVPTYTLQEMRKTSGAKETGDWYVDGIDVDRRGSVISGEGVKVTVDKEVEYDTQPYGKGLQ